MLFIWIFKTLSFSLSKWEQIAIIMIYSLICTTNTEYFHGFILSILAPDALTLPAITSSKLTIETLEKGVKYVQS